MPTRTLPFYQRPQTVNVHSIQTVYKQLSLMTGSAITKKSRADGQISSLAGEFFVAAELLKREIQTSVTFGNAKAIDLFAWNPRTGHTFTVQVKALRSKASYPFPISPDRVAREHMYVFVLFNKPAQPVQYFIVPGSILLDEPHRFGRWYTNPKFSGVRPDDLRDFENNWDAFEEM